MLTFCHLFKSFLTCINFKIFNIFVILMTNKAYIVNDNSDHFVWQTVKCSIRYKQFFCCYKSIPNVNMIPPPQLNFQSFYCTEKNCSNAQSRRLFPGQISLSTIQPGAFPHFIFPLLQQPSLMLQELVAQPQGQHFLSSR